MKEWAIVGAGPAGSHLAISLLARGRTELDDIVLVDPRGPLEMWRQRTANCGMTHLRSSSVHHIGVSTAALSKFEKRAVVGGKAWSGKVQSPSLQLFNCHCAHLCEEYSLGQIWSRARVERVARTGASFRLHTADGFIEAKRVVLALGPVWKPRLPPWLETVGERVSFLLDPDFSCTTLAGKKRLAILGGGMTSVQAALELCHGSEVTLFTRTPLRVCEFDVVPGWMGPVGGSFLSQNPEGRRRLISEKRRTGSVNCRVRREFEAALSREELSHRLIEAPVCSVSGGTISIRDRDGSLEVDHIVLGTGFEIGLHPLQQTVAREFGAPVSSCGVPLLGKGLEWIPGLYVAGCHAELELGPAAGNLIGARLAAERILEVA